METKSPISEIQYIIIWEGATLARRYTAVYACDCISNNKYECQASISPIGNCAERFTNLASAKNTLKKLKAKYKPKNSKMYIQTISFQERIYDA